MSRLYDCPGEETCLFTNDLVSLHDIEKTIGSHTVRWRWLLLGLPADAEAVVAPYREATAAAVDADAPSIERMHAAEHLLSAAGRALAAAGYIAVQSGTVDGLFAGKGLPKQPLERAEVWRCGLVGDVQREKKHHGRPSQALCLWSGEVVDALVAEGHPIHAGAAGENVSVRGVDWSLVRPGSIVRIGEITAELSGWALPCAKNRRWFLPGESKKAELRMDPDLHPGWSRAYAYVLTAQNRGVEGSIAVGDPVSFE